MKAERKPLQDAGRKGLAAAKWVNAKITGACEATCPRAPQERGTTLVSLLLTGSARRLAAVVFFTATTTGAIEGPHAEQVVLLKCVFEHVEKQKAPFLVQNASIFIEFDQNTSDAWIDQNTLATTFPFTDFQKIAGMVTANEIFLSYKSDALYLPEEYQWKYFNWFHATINRYDGSFNANAGPYYTIQKDGKEYFAGAGNINDQKPNVPFGFFLHFQSLGWGTCQREKRRI